MPDNKRAMEERTNVTVFGAGVAGLTVAHELVERGFRVQVWEPQTDDRYPFRGCDVGGLARTQWSRAHWPEWRDPTSEALPRVGKRPYELRWTANGTLIPSGKRTLESVVRQLVEDTSLEPEANVDVYARSFEALTGYLADGSFEAFTRALASEGFHAEPFAGMGFVARKADRSLKFRFYPRTERLHRKAILDTHKVLRRFEFYYRPEWGVSTEPLQHLPQKFYKLRDRSEQVLGAAGDQDRKRVAAEIARALTDTPGIEQVYVEVWEREDLTTKGGAADLEYALKIVSEIAGIPYPHDTAEWKDSGGPARYDVAGEFDGRIVDLTLVRLGPLPEDSPEEADLRVSFRIRERWFPGEHGYRFFPAFYHHLFDTMNRTPILESQKKSPLAEAQERATRVHAEKVLFAETNRTPRDNIVERPVTIIAIAGQDKPAMIQRSLPSSFAELLERFEIFLNSKEEGGFGASSRELTSFLLPYLRHLTTGATRRETYEEMSWFEFAGGANLSPDAQETLMRLPKALVAMDARESDARTIGEVGTQLLMDQFMQTGYRDGALNGPTSVAWLDHWRRYLEAQGVEFIHGVLEGLELMTDPDGAETIWPTVTCFEPRNFELDERGQLKQNPLLGGYIVLALPIVELKRIADDFVRTRGNHKKHRDLQAVADLDPQLDLGDPNDAEPKGEYKHFAGLQFYFAEDLFWIDGHAYYPDSPWAVTSISQTRRWTDRPDWEHGYRGVLSTIIGEWDTPGRLVPKRAWDCSAEELAKEVWHQIRTALQVEDKDAPSLPQPLYWHLDDSFRENPNGSPGPRWTNIYPYQVQAPGQWKKRPGNLRVEGDDAGYSSERGLVLAGTYMKTHTRITSMEAANESGRHAVNAILKDFGKALRTVRCEIWPLIDREYKDLEFWKELDEILVQRGLPHVMDILGVEFFVAEALRGGPDDPFHPTWLLRQLSGFARAGRWDPYSQWSARARRER